MPNKTYCVYKHTNKENGKVYIGITSCLDTNERWKDGFGYKDNKLFFKDITQYGWNNFEHEILYDKLSEQAALQIENDLILKYESHLNTKGYNIAVIQNKKEVSTITIPKGFSVDVDCIRHKWLKLPLLINPYISKKEIILPNGDKFATNKSFDGDCILIMLLIVSQNYNKQDEYLSNEKIASLIGVSVSAVKRAINLLCVLDIIVKNNLQVGYRIKRTMYINSDILEQLLNGTHWLYKINSK